MGETTAIEWTGTPRPDGTLEPGATFNPWWGCVKVSPACTHCYAATLANLYGTDWGPKAERKFFGDKHWNDPVRWNRKAEKAGVRKKVFCSSMADVFELLPEAHPQRYQMEKERGRLWELIRDTPSLDWLLLTKRPENIQQLVPMDWWGGGFPENVWVGATVENQEYAEERIPHLLRVPAPVRFLSCEPLLGPVDIEPWLRGGKTIHTSLHVEGALHNKSFDGFRHDDGSPMSRARAEEELKLLRYKGVKLIPMGDCEGFSYETGCPGHEQPRVNWVIAGGESGHGARPTHPDWIRSLRDQCVAASVPFFMKQITENGKKQPISEWPTDLVVREFPNAA